MRSVTGGRLGRLAAAGMITSVALLGACKNKQPPIRARNVAPSVTRDVPSVLRGTIGAEASLSGVQPLLVSGIGFVVGLDGTGGLPMPEEYASTMERDMGLMGIGRSADLPGALKGKTPRQLLQDPNTAVVLVQGAVPPGAREGSAFDVYVRAVNATSLEGGRLWTTELKPGPPSVFGGPQTLPIAKANGPIFINPFVDPSSQTDTVQRDAGRILDGGLLTKDMQVELILDNPSHDRASRIASAINSRFPEGTGDAGPIARGRDDTRVRVRVPRRFEDRPEEFLAVVQHLQIDRTYPEVYARRYAQGMRSEPYLANDLGWCLEGLGERALPFVRELYEYPEAAPRLAALRAGVGLDDPRAAPYLSEIAVNGPETLRVDAIELLSRLEAGPRIDMTLRELLGSEQLTIRVAAYEALVDRAIGDQRRRLMLMVEGQTGPGGVHLTRSGLDAMARMNLPTGTIQGVSRELVAGKFFLDRVPFGDPLIYVTQSGDPRIVVFGDDTTIHRPLLVSAWDDRLMIASDSESDPIRLYYRDPKRARVVTQEIEDDVVTLIRMMAHDQTPDDPRPGLGLSFAETVGAVYQLFRDDALSAAFASESDRLIADLLRSVQREQIVVRPERPGEEQRLVVFDSPRGGARQRPDAPRREGLLVPLDTATPAGEDGESPEGGE